MSVRLNYLYRDGGNYKRHAEAVFANPENLSIEELERRFRAAAGKWQLFEGTIHFRPESVGLETCYFTNVGYARNAEDFELHEVEQIETCDQAPTDRRTMRQFLDDVEAAKAY